MKEASMSRACLIAALLIILALVACAPKTPSSALDSTPTPATTPDSTPAIPPSQRVPRITIDELLQKINSHADILIVDSRIDVEKLFADGHIKGAVPVPLSQIMEGQWQPPADKEIIFYCTWPDEKTSARAALEVINKGFTNVEVLKGGYNAWKEAGYPIISYQNKDITFLYGSSVFDLFNPIKLELGQVITIEGYLSGSGYHPAALVMFVGVNDANEVVKRYVILKNFTIDNDTEFGAIIKVRGKIAEVRDGLGDMEVDSYEVIRKDIGDIIATVDAHWKDFGAELLEETHSSMIDGGVSSPIFNQKTQEVVLYHDIGNMQPEYRGYEPEVSVFYFVNLDGKITMIFLQYSQLK